MRTQSHDRGGGKHQHGIDQMRQVYRKIRGAYDGLTLSCLRLIVACVLAELIAFWAGTWLEHKALMAREATLRAAAAEISEANRRIGNLNQRLAAAHDGALPCRASIYTASTRQPHGEWTTPGARLVAFRKGRDALTGILIPTRELCAAMPGLAPQQQRDCRNARAIGTLYVGYHLDNGAAPE